MEYASVVCSVVRGTGVCNCCADELCSEAHGVARVRGELFQFRVGDYTLVCDQDPSECELHLLLHLCCEGENSSVHRA